MGLIYALCDLTGEVRYVGLTRQSVEARVRRHKQDKRNRPVNQWLAEIGEPLVVILEEDPEDLDSAEVKWIRWYKWMGADLLNVTAGRGPTPMTEETKQKLRDSWTPERRESQRCRIINLNRRRTNDGSTQREYWEKVKLGLLPWPKNIGRPKGRKDLVPRKKRPKTVHQDNPYTIAYELWEEVTQDFPANHGSRG